MAIVALVLAHVLDLGRPASRVTASIGAMVAVSMLIARTVLPPAMRVLAKYASGELYQLTIIAFCLVCGWLTGYLVRHLAPPRNHSSLRSSPVLPTASAALLLELGSAAWLRAG